MVELKDKIVLKDKGETKNLPTVKQLVATMKWKTAVDLDLMACYEGKNGENGGVNFRNLGDLNRFPFIKLSGDAGVGESGGAVTAEKEEELKITDLAEIGKLHLVAVNYTDAKSNQTDSHASFSDYDGHIEIKDDQGNVFDVPLTATEKGTVAHIATIDNTGAIGATLEMKNEVMQFNKFVESIPGALKLFS